MQAVMAQLDPERDEAIVCFEAEVCMLVFEKLSFAVEIDFQELKNIYINHNGFVLNLTLI